MYLEFAAVIYLCLWVIGGSSTSDHHGEKLDEIQKSW